MMKFVGVALLFLASLVGSAEVRAEDLTYSRLGGDGVLRTVQAEATSTTSDQACQQCTNNTLCLWAEYNQSVQSVSSDGLLFPAGTNGSATCHYVYCQGTQCGLQWTTTVQVTWEQQPPEPPVAPNEDSGGQCPDVKSTRPDFEQLCSNPINSGTGNKFQIESDFSGNGLLSFMRYYNSAPDTFTHAFGLHWTNTYTRIVRHSSETPTTAVVLRADGRASTFTLSGGIWTSAAHVEATLTRQVDGSGNTTGWTYQATDGREVEQYDALGRLTSIARADGTSVTLIYNYGLIESWS